MTTKKHKVTVDKKVYFIDVPQPLNLDDWLVLIETTDLTEDQALADFHSALTIRMQAAFVRARKAKTLSTTSPEFAKIFDNLDVEDKQGKTWTELVAIVQSIWKRDLEVSNADMVKEMQDVDELDNEPIEEDTEQ